MGFFGQLGLMLWKNWIIQRRKICVSIFELLLPIGFALLLLFLRSVLKPQPEDNNTYYDVDRLALSYLDIPDPSVIGYAPNGIEVKKVMDEVEHQFKVVTLGISNATFQGFVDEAAMEEYYKTHSNLMHLCVSFYNVDNASGSLPKDLDFAVRPYSGKVRWRTRQTYRGIPSNAPVKSGLDYDSRGVLYFQHLVGESFIKYWLDKIAVVPNDFILGTYTQRFAYPPYIDDPMIFVVQGILPLFFVLSFILSVVINTKNLVYEKERKLKESMKLMGLKSSVHWWSWFITFWIYLLPALALYTVLISANIISSKGPILRASDGSLVLVFFLVYGLAIITFCFMTASFVQKANVGAAVGGILFFATYGPFFYVSNNYEDLSRSGKMGLCLLFNCGMGLGTTVIGLYEGTGEGVQWDNFHKPATVDDNLSLFDCMMMLLVDSVIHLVIYWYLDNVRPGEFGVPKPFYFCFTKSYWFGAGKNSNKMSYHDENREANVRFEKEPENLNAGIVIKNLTKEFGSHVAVQGLSLNMYDGQISVLLGHNGAGKTTTMSMLTGFIQPTSGTAIVNEYDITKNIDGVRSSLGLCPQHNILFDSLTVKEHLQFFARLKGATNQEAEAEIETLLPEVGLQGKITSQSHTLSGGQKRKLSVAIALIAGSKVVILDEPSSGMDPSARRQTWNVLQKHRHGRTMLLTTHYMDEADVLGDRIAIMAEGVIKCCGSSMFLKKLYGAGYHMVVVKDQSCDVDQLTSVVQSHVENAKLETIINLEVSYLLPDKDTSKFAALFTDLALRKAELGISSFGTSATTMEEVFLKVGDSAVHHDDISRPEENGFNGIANPAFDDKNAMAETSHFGKNKIHSSGNNMEMVGKEDNTIDFNSGYTKRDGFSLMMGRMYGLFVKKALHTWRNRVITLVQLFLPVIFLIAGLALVEQRPEVLTDPLLKLNLDPFDRTKIPLTAGLTPTNDDNGVVDAYKKQFGIEQDIEHFVMGKNQTYDNYTIERAEALGIGTFKKRMIIGFETGPRQQGETIHAIGHYNGAPLHAQPIAVNYMMNALVQFYLGTGYSYQSSVYPLPQDLKESSESQQLVASGDGFIIGIFISFGMAFLTTLFIHYLIKERQVGAKHLQVVSGVDPFTFWIPTFLWDFINYIVPTLLLLVVFVCYQKMAYTGDERGLYVILILLAYGWAVLPFMYVLQFLFKEPPTGVVTVILINIFSGLICLTAVFTLSIPELDVKDIADTCHYIFMVLFPNYAMAQSFVSLSENYENTASCESTVCRGQSHPCCKDTCESFGNCYSYEKDYLAYDRPGIGSMLLCMFIQGVVYFTLILLIEFNVFQRIWYRLASSKGPDMQTYENNISNAEDDDVAAERQRVNSNPASVLSNMDSLLLVNLFKQYGTFVAVDHICVGIPQQECFGLLGQNGAGKTTTFKMLTGDVMVTGGNAFLNGQDIRNDIKQVQANLGYCPQFDALIDQMTGRETLTMYARLRGVPEDVIPGVVNQLITTLMFEPHADKLSGKYSGGNKRKLSTAIALVGDPHFIMLDEPSAGMDPKARRQLWNVLSKVRASGRTLMLTSHSMEECDALCTRIAIMVNGRFVCLGSPQHLKSKFGQGYTLIVQMGHQDDNYSSPIQPVIEFICSNFPGAKVFDDHQGYVHFQVPDSTVQLANVFSLMESTKVSLNVQDYSVHQTTLEQIFLTFTRKQVVVPTNARRFKLCCF